MGKSLSVSAVSILIISGLLGFIGLQSETASVGTTWYVGSGPGNNSATIDGALNLAGDGDTVFVYSGTYIESIVIDKTINLTGENIDTTLIRGDGAASNVRISADFVNVTGFSIRSLGGSTGMLVESSNNTIHGNNVSDNIIGVLFQDSDYNVLSDNSIFSSMGPGISLTNSDNNMVMNNTVNLGGTGLTVFESSGNTFKNNSFSHSPGKGIILEGSPGNDVIGNVVIHNGLIGPPPNGGVGILLQSSSMVSDFNNIVGNVVSHTGSGILLDFGNENKIIKNVVSNSFRGIMANGSGGNTVKDNVVYSNFDNILVSFGDWNDVIGNAAYNGTYGGVHLYKSSQNMVSGNEAFDNKYGIYIDGLVHNNIMADNDVHGNEIGIFINDKTNNNTIRNNTVSSNTEDGIRIGYYNNWTRFIDNSVSGSKIGINIWLRSNYNQIMGNKVFGNSKVGVLINGSDLNHIEGNDISNNHDGILLISGSKDSVLTSNYISGNSDMGIGIENTTTNTTITRNFLASNWLGVGVWGSENNSIHHNAFLTNVNQAFDNTSSNRWNDSYPSGGNYWSDWSPVCQDLFNGAITPQTGGGGPDNVCDLQYDLIFNTADYYPLTLAPDTWAPMISNLQPPDGSVTSNDMPTVSAEYWDLSGIDVGSVLLEVDGLDRTASSLVTPSSISYTPLLPLMPGPHVVYLEVRDIYGNIAFEMWSFTVDPTPKPPRITDLSVIGGEINITWSLSPSSNVEAYDIYSGPTQTSINLNDLLFATPDEGPPAQQWWAQFTFDTTANREYYFVVRARSTILQERSVTSNTMGYYRMDFGADLNTFSLPLKPLVPQSLDALMLDIGASSISWLDDSSDWQTYPANPVAPMAEMGEGYVVEFPVSTTHVFAGEPASMILYNDNFGFDDSTRDVISASVNTQGDVSVYWTPMTGINLYCVLRSNERDGFHTGNYTSFDAVLPPFIDAGAAGAAGELYYIVVPSDFAECRGSSTYSIGVITEEYNGNEILGLPLKPHWGAKSADWYADSIPNCLGIVFFEGGVWKAHFREFPEGVYDIMIEYGRGYVLTASETTLYSFLGF